MDRDDEKNAGLSPAGEDGHPEPPKRDPNHDAGVAWAQMGAPAPRRRPKIDRRWM